MQIIFNLPTLASAAGELLKAGVLFNNVLCPPIYHGKHWYTNQDDYRRGIHHYFMNGNSDVAYWTEGMNSLLIHDTPRFWGEPPILKEAKANDLLTSATRKV